MSARTPEAPAISGTPAAEVLRRLELSVTRRLDGLLQGDHRGLTPGHGSEPGDIRAYQPGDDVRRIDWNVTARLRETHVRDTVADRELETWMLVDASASLAFGTADCEKRDLALAAVAATGFLTARTGNRVGAMTVGPAGASAPIPARSGRVHLQALLRQVLSALSNPGDGRTELTTGLRRIAGIAKRRGLVVVISDFLDPGPWAPALRTLALRHDVLCIEVVDPVELALPDVGMLVLHDTESGAELEVATGDRKLRERYAAAAVEQRAAIAAQIRGSGADHLQLRTDRDWLLDLARFVGRRRDRVDALSRSAAHGSGPVDAIPGATMHSGGGPMSGLAFLSPWRLLLLFVVVALAVVYVVFQRRRSSYAVRFTNLDLLESVAPKRPGWRRHLTAAVQLLALATLVVAFAQPTHEVKVPRERATVVMAIDVSLSMEATDVEPDRISAAKAAATSFLDDVPAEVNVGLVSFSGTSSLEVAPTTDRKAVADAIADLQLGEGTAIGSAIDTSLDALGTVPPAPDGSVVPAAIVVMSDGTTTMGVANEDAAARAKEEAVPVSTIAFGTANGTVVIGDTGEVVRVPVDAKSLAAIADETGGQSYEAATQGQLADVYASIGSSIGFDTVDSDITEWFVAAAMLGFVLSAGFALAWSNRIP